MHLEEAKAKGKLEHFIRERKKTPPRANKHHFHGVIRADSAALSHTKRLISLSGYKRLLYPRKTSFCFPRYPETDLLVLISPV